MFLAVKGYCSISEYADILNRLKGFTALLALFVAIIEKIQLIREAQEYDFRGVTRTKEQTKALLIKKLLWLIRRLKAYANEKDLLELANAVNYSKSDLESCADTVLTDRSRIITSATDGHMTALTADYNVTPAAITEINTLRDEFIGDVPKPRLGFVNRKTATTALKNALKEGTEKLHAMDVIVDMLADSEDETETNIFNGYNSARAIVDIGGRKKKNLPTVWGKVIDFGTGLPISNARVSIVGTTMVVVTLEDGTFKFALKNFGLIQIRVEKEGYKTTIEDEVNVTADMEEVVIEMENA